MNELYVRSTTKFADKTVSSFVDGTQAYTYAEFGKKCDALSEQLSFAGVGAGDKVAILSENMPHWTLAFFSATAFGRVAVPILPDCSANEVVNILNHSETKALFVSERQISKIPQEVLDSMSIVVNLNTLAAVSQVDPMSVSKGMISRPQPDDLAAIIYTSGTSGKAKGVMLSHRNLCHNISASPDVQIVRSRHAFLSVLPMGHTYEMSLAMLYPFSEGAKVWYLNGAPTPSVLIKAFAKVKPNMMCSVPLIIEKIYRKSVLATIRKSPSLTWMQKHVPALLYTIIGIKLRKTFGGHLKVFAIGGAKLDSEVEAFLKKAHFPYAIGYGMTEMAPLICAVGKHGTVVGSTGPAMFGVQVKLLNPDPVTGEGEIVCKGPNTMLGYYKDPERTKEAFTEDGWLHTKDLAAIDAKGRYFIKGRLGNMILGASGENIYPEEIEMVLNGFEGVEDSLVAKIDGHLVAMVKLASDALDFAKEGEAEFHEKAEAIKAKILSDINAVVNKASQISSIRLMKEPFEKTATHKIRRFLYTS